jgi:hypothetical protein
MLLALTVSLVLFNIPTGPARTTLRQFADQSDLNMLFRSDEVGAQITHAISGRLDPQKALQLMTRGSGLQFQTHGRTGSILVSVDDPPRKTRTEPTCECIILGGFMRTPYCDDGGPKIRVRKQCAANP